MSLRGWLKRIEGTWNGSSRDREFAAEVESHVALAADDHQRSGITPEAARRQAVLELGGVQAAREAYREQAGLPILDHLMRDLRYGWRVLRRSPGYTSVALLALALGIGANTALFSVVYNVLLRPLPYADASHLLVLRQEARAVNVDDIGFSVKEINDFRARAHTVDDIEEYHGMYFVLLNPQPDRVETGVVSAGFFPMPGVKQLLGRLFVPSDDQIGAPPVLVLSYEYWQRAFGGDPKIVGRTVRMNDKVHTIVGVLPQIPQYPRENDVYMPVSACPFRSNQRHLLYSALVKASKAAGLGVIGWHTMRHSYRSWLDDTGAPMTVQQNLMRHASITTTMNIYGDAIPKTLRKAHGKVVRMAFRPTNGLQGTVECR